MNELTGIMSVRLPVQTAGDGWVCGCVCVQKKEFPYIGEHQYIGAPACVVAYEPTRAEPIPRVCLCVCFLPCPYVTPHSAEVSLLHTPLTEVCVLVPKKVSIVLRAKDYTHLCPDSASLQTGRMSCSLSAVLIAAHACRPWSVARDFSSF